MARSRRKNSEQMAELLNVLGELKIEAQTKQAQFEAQKRVELAQLLEENKNQLAKAIGRALAAGHSKAAVGRALGTQNYFNLDAELRRLAEVVLSTEPVPAPTQQPAQQVHVARVAVLLDDEQAQVLRYTVGESEQVVLVTRDKVSGGITTKPEVDEQTKEAIQNDLAAE